MDIAAFIQRRGVYLVGTLSVVSLFIFALTQILPGDVATMNLGRTAPAGEFNIRCVRKTRTPVRMVCADTQ